MPIEKINSVLHWAEFNDHFDTEFIESLAEAYEEYDSLTYNQEVALDNIIDGYNIDTDKW